MGPRELLVSLVGVGKIDWLGHSDNALWAVAIADAWTWTPFVILLATAAFRGIPQEIRESAEIDGASPIYIFFRVTFPMSLTDHYHRACFSVSSTLLNNSTCSWP